MEKFNKVVGLQYNIGEGLPKVILKGSGKIADEILRQANKPSAPRVVQNEELVNQLYRLPIDADISEDLFEVVAILLAHVFAVNEKIKGEENG